MPAFAILLLVGLAVIIIIALIPSTECSNCVRDNYRSEECETCENFKDSLRRSYLDYCKHHDRYKHTDREETK